MFFLSASPRTGARRLTVMRTSNSVPDTCAPLGEVADIDRLPVRDNSTSTCGSDPRGEETVDFYGNQALSPRTSRTLSMMFRRCRAEHPDSSPKYWETRARSGNPYSSPGAERASLPRHGPCGVRPGSGPVVAQLTVAVPLPVHRDQHGNGIAEVRVHDRAAHNPRSVRWRGFHSNHCGAWPEKHRVFHISYSSTLMTTTPGGW